MTLIKQEDAIETVKELNAKINDDRYGTICTLDVLKRIGSLPSAEANGEDLIIKGAKGIQDGLYNIKDGKLFKYKANGGTVRTYPIVPSAEAEWIPCSERLPSDDEYVIVSVFDDHGDTPWKYTTVAWLCNGVWISDNDILCGTAVAWMPLPKPYREDGKA